MEQIHFVKWLWFFGSNILRMYAQDSKFTQHPIDCKGLLPY